MWVRNGFPVCEKRFYMLNVINQQRVLLGGTLENAGKRLMTPVFQEVFWGDFVFPESCSMLPVHRACCLARVLACKTFR